MEQRNQIESSKQHVEALLASMMGLHPKDIDLGLERLVRLLEKLGNPHEKLPPVIHLAGTNGKGSTSAFLRAMLEAQGLRVHVYTSPHLVDFRERIRLAGQLVSHEALADALVRCKEANDDDLVTFFEITTAAAFLLFAKHEADITLLEVGLGGRLDATNVVDAPLLSVITPIARDHEEYLGNSLPLIAREKAGIFKKSVPAIVGLQEDEVRDTLEQEAAKKRTGPLSIAGQDWMVYEEHGRLIFQDETGLLDLPLPRLLGHHQQQNAGMAIAALRMLAREGKIPLSDDAILQGLQTVDWPARLQKLSGGTLFDLVPKGAELWLDGGHNPQAGQALAAALADLEDRSPRPLHMIVGMLKTKDPTGYFAAFKGLARDVITVPVKSQPNGQDPVALAGLAMEAGVPASAAASVQDALKKLALIPREAPPRILIAGSLYLAGEVLTENGTAPE
ncbi:MAG: bifunctional folylpolyglutamate synthase/dihydrofolate synthase [Cohaesibacter sp.]|jgi:dihydrofolate synthase/folylpolyglutamate synthase|nr:bifunctional folylpolyglutamate synthase/dihydrofolate synthase [Cohaesibacter sp.]